MSVIREDTLPRLVGVGVRVVGTSNMIWPRYCPKAVNHMLKPVKTDKPTVRQSSRRGRRVMHVQMKMSADCMPNWKV